ncbi:alkanesulfonate monooxygenase SsuD/methylene tetrahydromethanopterin reductase-like flavin-dependent oxidoreductase (luciferase family) [Bradyrhizobium sp. GM24.11]
MRDKESGRYFSPEKMHVLNHTGEFFSIRGPLNISRPPQGYPVIAQAGGSGPGQELAVWSADLVYTAQKSDTEARHFHGELKGRLSAHGRSPESLIVLPGVLPIIGRTQSEAEEKREELTALLNPAFDMQSLEDMFGDLSGFCLDDLAPPISAHTNAVKSLRDAWEARLKIKPMTLRQVYNELSTSTEHRLIVGTPQLIADELEHWFTSEACDGVNIMVPYMPGPFHEFLDTVVPELRRRGGLALSGRGHGPWSMATEIEPYRSSGSLVLLRHKVLRDRGRRIALAQHGHRDRLLTRARTSRRRIVAIEFGMCRSVRSGGASGFVTFGKGRRLEQPG